VIGLVAGAVATLLHNWIASVIGGIEMELRTKAERSSGAAAFARESRCALVTSYQH